MPIYEYECGEHGRFSAFSTKFREGHTETYCEPCPECGKFCKGVFSLSSHRWKHTGPDGGRDMFADGQGFHSTYVEGSDNEDVQKRVDEVYAEAKAK